MLLLFEAAWVVWGHGVLGAAWVVVAIPSLES